MAGSLLSERAVSVSGRAVSVSWTSPAGVSCAGSREPSAPSLQMAGPWRRRARSWAVCAWETATGKRRHRLPASEDGALALAFAPDGRRLAGSAEDGILRLWDTATGRQLHRVETLSPFTEALAFTPDGRAITCWDEGGELS